MTSELHDGPVWYKSGQNLFKDSRDSVIVMFVATFIICGWQPSWTVSLQTTKIVPCRDHSDNQFAQNPFEESWDIVISMFHLRWPSWMSICINLKESIQISFFVKILAKSVHAFVRYWHLSKTKTHKQKADHYDLVLIQIFYFIKYKDKDPIKSAIP